MSDLFDLPFEEDKEDGRASPELGTTLSSSKGRQTAVGSPQSPVASHQSSVASPVDARPQPDARRVLTVTELTVRIRDLLEEQFTEIWVEGEISNCRVWNTGHLFCTLKDEASQIRLVVFRTTLRYLRFKPADGLKIVARGKLSVYEPKGEYQLICEHMEPQGLGALQLAFDQLKARLGAEGLFDADRKRPLPALPRKIGIVTSLEGAAIRDIIKVLRRRYANAHVVIGAARVQGEDAAPEVARALRRIARISGVDVIIVGRGGGSIEDLWAFNEELVARAIANTPVPVISAVGHETDFTIADFVADVRAPTPSAAAELVVAAKEEFVRRIEQLRTRLHAATRHRLQGLARRMHIAEARPAFAGFHGRMAMRGRRTDDLVHHLSQAMRARVFTRDRRTRTLERQLVGFDPGRRLASIRARLVLVTSALAVAASHRRQRSFTRFRDAVARLDSLSPLAVLGRGYSVCWTADGIVVRAAADVAAGDRVRVTLSRGEIEAKVSQTHE